MEEERPEISVVVPTRSRPQLLRRCVAALQAQTVPVEIVVVEDTAGRGPAWGRNEGVGRARGKVVCFTDDDCAPAPGWAQALTAPLLSGVGQVATGPVLMGLAATTADRAWEAILAYLQQQAGRPGTTSPGFAATANLAARRELLEHLPFDESFPTAAGEDRDWGERAARLGAEAGFVAGALVVHRSGLTVRGFLRQQYRYGRGGALYRQRSSHRRLGSLSFYLGLARRGFAAGLGPGLLVGAAQAAALAGVVAASVLQET